MGSFGQQLYVKLEVASFASKLPSLLHKTKIETLEIPKPAIPGMVVCAEVRSADTGTGCLDLNCAWVTYYVILCELLTFLSFSFLNCKMRIIMKPTTSKVIVRFNDLL